MTVFVWTHTRDRAIELFRGDTPGAQLEHTILTHFEKEPQRVIDTIEQIGRSIQRGGPNAPVSGWAVLNKNLTTQPAERVVTDHTEMAKQLTIAETWIRNAGGNIDRQDELISELYDPDLGRLRHWPDTQPDIIKIWAEHRPRFIAAEAASLERQYAQAETRKRLVKAIGTGHAIDAELHADRITNQIERARHAQDPHRDDYLDQLATTHEEPEGATA